MIAINRARRSKFLAVVSSACCILYLITFETWDEMTLRFCLPVVPWRVFAACFLLDLFLRLFLKKIIPLFACDRLPFFLWEFATWHSFALVGIPVLPILESMALVLVELFQEEAHKNFQFCSVLHEAH